MVLLAAASLRRDEPVPVATCGGATPPWAYRPCELSSREGCFRDPRVAQPADIAIDDAELPGGRSGGWIVNNGRRRQDEVDRQTAELVGAYITTIA